MFWQATVAVTEKTPAEVLESAPKQETSSEVSQQLGEQLRKLGSLASEVALSFGMKALGIPPIEQLLNELLSDTKAEPTEQATSSLEQAEEVSPRSSSSNKQKEPVLNGVNRNSNFLSESL